MLLKCMRADMHDKRYRRAEVEEQNKAWQANTCVRTIT